MLVPLAASQIPVQTFSGKIQLWLIKTIFKFWKPNQELGRQFVFLSKLFVWHKREPIEEVLHICYCWIFTCHKFFFFVSILYTFVKCLLVSIVFNPFKSNTSKINKTKFWRNIKKLSMIFGLKWNLLKRVTWFP